MIQLRGSDLWRDNVKLGWIHGEHFYDYRGDKLGSTFNDWVFDPNGKKLAHLDGEYVYTPGSSERVRLEDAMAQIEGDLPNLMRIAVKIFFGN